VAKSIRCRLGMHRWVNKWDHERSLAIKECQLCGNRITKVLVPPGQLTVRPPSRRPSSRRGSVDGTRVAAVVRPRGECEEREIWRQVSPASAAPKNVDTAAGARVVFGAALR
jgi:hypothetical protein